MRYILIAFALYFGYRFLVGFLIPVIVAALRIRKQFEAVRNNQGFQQTTSQRKKDKKGSSKSPKDDYIDFEEIK